MRVSASRSLMGNYVNGKVASTLGWLTVAIMAGSSIALFATGGISF
jgi:Mn2+/Fe2+ NRAMP family transporter